MSCFTAIKWFVCCILAILCGGCATIMGQSSYDIQIDSSEPGTNVEILEHGKFVESVVTPATVKLKSSGEWHWFSGRQPALYAFKFSKEGFESQLECRNGEMNWWYLGNIPMILCFYAGAVGMWIDIGTGALHKLDDTRIYAEMKKLPTVQAAETDKKPENVVPTVNEPTVESANPDNQQAGTSNKYNEEPPVAQTSQADYRIIICERENGNDFSYSFILELKGNDAEPLSMFRTIQQKFRAAIKEDYAESFPGVKKDSLFVEFTKYKLDNGKIEGRAVVLTISVVAMKYDPASRTGTLSVRVNANQYEEARKWIRKNIETLARDKNVALTTGEIPPAAKFYLGKEELKDGNILEIEFKTE